MGPALQRAVVGGLQGLPGSAIPAAIVETSTAKKYFISSPSVVPVAGLPSIVTVRAYRTDEVEVFNPAGSTEVVRTCAWRPEQRAKRLEMEAKHQVHSVPCWAPRRNWMANRLSTFWCLGGVVRSTTVVPSSLE